MILSRIMKAVKVSRDYEIEIDFTVDFEQIGDMADPGSNCDERLNDTPENLKKAVSF